MLEKNLELCRLMVKPWHTVALQMKQMKIINCTFVGIRKNTCTFTRRRRKGRGGRSYQWVRKEDLWFSNEVMDQSLQRMIDIDWEPPIQRTRSPVERMNKRKIKKHHVIDDALNKLLRACEYRKEAREGRGGVEFLVPLSESNTLNTQLCEHLETREHDWESWFGNEPVTSISSYQVTL